MTPLKFAAFVVGSLALVAGGMGIGRERTAIQVVKEHCEPVRIETFVPVGFAPQALPQPVVARAEPAPRPARPQAPPPLPFRYIGRMIEDGKLEIFLVRGEEHFSVAAGDMLGVDYRVEAVSDTEVVLVYLPLNARQRLPL